MKPKGLSAVEMAILQQIRSSTEFTLSEAEGPVLLCPAPP